MTKWTHIRQFDGFSRGPLTDSVRPYPDQIRHALTTMNGTSKWAYSLWRAPEGADLLEDIPFSDEYLQCAGSVEAMTIEVRIVDDEGEGHQYVVGKPTETARGEPTVVIPRENGKHSDTVYPHEAFTADEAAEIFYAYFLTDRVPEQYQLRELDLTWPPAKPALTFSAHDLSEAIVVYLTNYPRSNAQHFEATFPGDAARDAVREVLTETLRLEPDWNGKSLSEVSRDVREMMHDRHPELSAAALRSLGNYFSYQVK